MDPGFFIHLSADRHSGRFPIVAVGSNAAVNTGCTFFPISVRLFQIFPRKRTGWVTSVGLLFGGATESGSGPPNVAGDETQTLGNQPAIPKTLTYRNSSPFAKRTLCL